jgi:osmotically-inducible protein OsmY
MQHWRHQLREWLLLGGIVLACGCEAKDQDCLKGVAAKLGAKTQAMTAETRQHLAKQFHVLRTTTEEVGLDAKVTARLRWDKSLADAPIHIHVTGAAVELTGTVRDAEQQKRAVDLAESTAGVETVKDALTIENAAAAP